MSGLTLDALTVRRGSCPVVDGVSFTAAAGAVTVLVGPNGAGKSSVLKALLGLLPGEGTMRWLGRDLAGLPAAERARLLAYVPQRSQLAAALPVRTVVAAARYAHHGWLAGGGSQDQAAVEAALAAVDAIHLAGRAFNALSAGEQQRVLVARALAGEAPCILMDEPTAALDVGHALVLYALARRLAAEGRCVVMVLHHLDDARRVADHLVLLHHGRVLAAGDAATVLTDAPLAEAFRVAPQSNAAMGFRLLDGAP
jgi:iron complex transport system ATP-binding protein